MTDRAAAMPAMRFTVTPADVLRHEVDPEARLSRFPASYTMKGLFFTQVLERLGPHAPAAIAALPNPPRGGRFLPFSDYPQVDYGRLLLATLKKLYPGVGMAQANRLLAREDVRAFAATTLGNVTLKFIRDPQAALVRLPDIYRLVMKGGIANASAREGSVRFVFRDFFGSLDCYTIGTIEGLVGHYGGSTTITADLASEVTGTLDVTWS